MAVSSSTINWDNVNTFTGRRALPRVVDNIFRSNPTLLKLWQKGTKLDGGAYIVQQLGYGEGPGGPFEGLEPHDTTDAEIATVAVYNWKHYYASITIRRVDELKNNGRAAFGKLLQFKIETAQRTMKNLLAQGLYSDGSTNPKAITGTRAMVTASGVTYGNIDKTLNSWWRSYVDTTTTLAALTTLGPIRTMLGQTTEDADTPDMLVSPQAIYDRVYNILQPQQRFASKAMADAGFTSIIVDGRPLTVDSHVPTGYLYALNTDYMDFVSHQDENMRFEPFKSPYNQAGRTAYIYWLGNLSGSNCRYQGVMTALI